MFVREKVSFAPCVCYYFSSAFNTISLMKLIGKLNTLGLRPPHKRTPDGSDWQSDLHSAPEPRRAACSAPSCSHCTPVTALPDIEGTHQGYREVCRRGGDSAIISRIINNHKSSYQEEINNLAERCTESNLLLNVSKTRELSVDFQKNGGEDTHPCQHRWSR